MRFLLLLLGILLASPSLAQTPDERAYVAERDRAAALVKAAPEAERPAVQKRWMPGLEARLRRLIGPGVPKGFNGPSAMSPEALCCYIGVDMLDGIRFTTPDDAGAVLVSTEGLLRQWRNEHNPWWSDVTRAPPVDPARAFVTSDFYTSSGVGLDSATLIHTQLPIAPPAGAGPAAAVLVQVGQMHDGNFPPQHIAAALIRNGRVYVALVKATTKSAPIAACGAILAEFHRKAGVASGSDKTQLIRKEGEAAFEKCWSERAKDQPGFAAVVRQAQQLVDALAAP